MDNRTVTMLAGIGLGAGLMYMCDPQMGRRRRALLRDQANHFWHESQEGLDTLARDVSNRTTGLIAETRSRFSGEQVDDGTLVARVRSHIGRAVSHPHAIHVTAQDGRITLSGPILAEEVCGLMSSAWATSGVKDVENRLDVHQSPGNVSSLQGGHTRSGARWELFQENWSPSARLLVSLTGAGMVAYGLTEGFPVGCVIGTAGLGLMATALCNKSVNDLLPEQLSDWLPESRQQPSASAESSKKSPEEWNRGMATAAMGVTGL